MKTIIFSDTHLTHKFNKRQFDYLKRIVESADRVIINGDFWDGYTTTFDKFLSSRWNQLFSLLKAKQTFYIYGNHDPRRKLDKRVKLFSIQQTDQIEIIVGKNKLHIEHGHRLAPSLEMQYPSLFENRYTIKLNDYINHLGLIVTGWEWYVLKNSKTIRRVKREVLSKYEDKVLVVSHLHHGEIDLKHNYINTGAIDNGFASYLVINEEKLQLVKERY